MPIKQFEISKTPIIKVNKALNQLADKVLFPKKLEEANKIFKKTSLPKIKTR